MNEAFWIAAGLALAFALSFVLSGMEAGLPGLGRLRIRHLQRRGHAGARVLQGFLDAPEDFLWTILIGNTLANFALLCLALYVLNRALGGHRWGLLGALAVVAFLNYALADLLPKMLFRQFPNRLCLALARPFRLIHLALAPAVALVTRLANLLLRATGGRRFTGRLFASREELRQVMQESAAALTPDEQAMVNRVLDLQKLTVNDLMVPLASAITLPADTPVSAALRLAAESGFERLPVRDATGSVIGLVLLQDLLHQAQSDPGRRVDRCLLSAVFLEETMRLEEALQRLKRTGQRMAIVLDHQRRETGLLTLTDILRFIFGEVKR